MTPQLLKTLVCLERQQQVNIPEESITYRKKLSTSYGLVFYEDRINVPKNLLTTVISLLHKGHPAINKMSVAARHFWWPKNRMPSKRNATGASHVKCPVKTLNILYRERKKFNYRHLTNRTKKSNCISSVQSRKRTVCFSFYFLLTNLVNGQPQAVVKHPTKKRPSDFWNNI